MIVSARASSATRDPNRRNNTARQATRIRSSTPPPPPPPPPPSNNNFATAETITGASGTLTGTNAGATKEGGEPAHAGNNGGASVWYRWTSPVTGNVRLQTCGSALDTLLAVYTGATVSSLALIAANDDACLDDSVLIANVATGIDYYVAVDGFDGETGSFTLQWSPLRPPAGPSTSAAYGRDVDGHEAPNRVGNGDERSAGDRWSGVGSGVAVRVTSVVGPA
jgi:hypothetical protein